MTPALSRRLRIVAFLGCLGSAHGALDAQQAIHGTVVNARTLEPVESASILLFAPGGAVHSAALSDSIGRFQFDLSAPGMYSLRVQRIGFAALRDKPISVDAHSMVRITVPLTPMAVVLEGVTVEANPVPAVSRIREFEDRRRMHIGYSFNQEDFKRLRAEHVRDLLPEIPGFVTLGGGSPSERTYAINFRRCPPRVYIDGVYSRLPVTELLENLSLWNVYGVEVIRNWGETPAEFVSHCGVILIWTRLMQP